MGALVPSIVLEEMGKISYVGWCVVDVDIGAAVDVADASDNRRDHRGVAAGGLVLGCCTPAAALARMPTPWRVPLACCALPMRQGLLNP